MTEQEEQPGLISLADEAYEAIRAINHLTINASSVPAPVAYRVLGNLKMALGCGAEQALNQLGGRLAESLDDFDLTEDDERRNAAASVAEALDNLHAAAALASSVGSYLAAAQSAIAGQGHRGRLRESGTSPRDARGSRCCRPSAASASFSRVQ
ncbi:hypothetical protein GCM10022286_24900 [Gryllotalpicola daejeonensis]|uniref:HPt domain-containing protein n=1 Tax=Gryllotalpicola daejeonensis TaxID=993087 RepID=A0ABP7ZM18_9MICO